MPLYITNIFKTLLLTRYQIIDNYLYSRKRHSTFICIKPLDTFIRFFYLIEQQHTITIHHVDKKKITSNFKRKRKSLPSMFKSLDVHVLCAWHQCVLRVAYRLKSYSKILLRSKKMCCCFDIIWINPLIFTRH